MPEIVGQTAADETVKANQQTNIMGDRHTSLCERLEGHARMFLRVSLAYWNIVSFDTVWIAEAYSRMVYEDVGST